ncbi:MAG: hypothetical protein KKB50_18600, partial [Planctomycetes bacterium]|nr:hypothetical protein [Planctomycetota bacterium]
DAATPIGLEVSLPENAAMSDSAVMLGNRAIVALPKGVQPLRRERSWGCASGGEPLPGWARPKSPCDPAFGNIRAGMGGVPLIYRFAVPAGEERTVVLGFCESHWTSAGQRPLEIYVEGAAKSDIDPIARWGRHGPGCLRFAARDANSDGRLQVVIAPHPNAADKNTILNVLWVFMPDIYVDPDEVQIGKAPEAEYHVDVGGETDQLLYDGSKLSYEFQLEAGGRRELLFLLASPGARSVPDPQTMAWTSDSLRQAAEEVWAGQRE